MKKYDTEEPDGAETVPFDLAHGPSDDFRWYKERGRSGSTETETPRSEKAPADSPHPPWPTLNAEDYFVEPRLEELMRLAWVRPGALEALPGLTVGRRNFGQVRFLGPVDVRGLALDDIIRFGEAEIRVYMDTTMAKPPPGEGLNVPAHVTLFNVHARNTEIGARRTGEGGRRRFLGRLKRHAAKQDAEFVAYQAGTTDTERNVHGGEWTFEVRHFSRYDAKVEDGGPTLGEAIDAHPEVDPVDLCVLWQGGLTVEALIARYPAEDLEWLRREEEDEPGGGRSDEEDADRFRHRPRSLTEEALAAHPDMPEDDRGLLRELDSWVKGDEAGNPHPITDGTWPTAIVLNYRRVVREYDVLLPDHLAMALDTYEEEHGEDAPTDEE